MRKFPKRNKVKISKAFKSERKWHKRFGHIAQKLTLMRTRPYICPYENKKVSSFTFITD